MSEINIYIRNPAEVRLVKTNKCMAHPNYQKVLKTKEMA